MNGDIINKNCCKAKARQYYLTINDKPTVIEIQLFINTCHSSNGSEATASKNGFMERLLLFRTIYI
ncbi:hypothetical protein T03_4217 [Trichinella britovi]|uniref:Uncharacterized protein n=1 Tax=Trichinella britovi TaxID=45882 RepID=A0A0V1C9X5_TRIBR|nr:hypothetical protein T03_4217 [Trichinella britovi]